MQKITGRRIEEKYASGERDNSFYKEQTMDQYTTNSSSVSYEGSHILYYIDNNTNQLKMKNTLLLG